MGSNLTPQELRNQIELKRTELDELVEKQIYNELRVLDSFRKDTNNLYDFLGYSLKHGLIMPIDFGIINNIKNPRYYISAISESGLVFLNKELL